MLGRGRSGRAWWAKSCGCLVGGEVEVGEDDDAGRRVLQDLSTPAGLLARRGSVRGAGSRASRRSRSAGERTAGTTDRYDGRGSPSPGRADPAGPSGLAPRGSATASSRARPRRRGDRPGPASRPARSRGPEWPRWRRSPRSSSSNRRLRPSQSSRAARASRAACGAIRPIRAISPENGSNPEIPAPLDHRQGRPLARDPADPIWPHRITSDRQAQVMGPRERRHRLDLDRDLADLRPLPSCHDQPGEHPAFMGEDRRTQRVGDRLPDVAKPPRVRPRPVASPMTR